MRTKLGILLMEEQSGEVAVQLFEEPDKALDAFKELKGKQGDPKRRATFLKVEWTEAGVLAQAESRDLPVPIELGPDGFRIGEGPIKLEQ